MRYISLNWTNPGDTDFEGIKIYRKIGEGGTWSLIDTLSKTSTSYSQYLGNDLNINTSYIYGLASFDRLGNESARQP